MAKKQSKVSESKTNSEIQLEDQPYFYGYLIREEINAVLKREGDFIVRDSRKLYQNNQIIISVFWNGKPLHFPIKCNDDGFSLGGESFPSVPELIEFYASTKTVLSQKSGAILKRPLKKQKWQLKHEDLQLIKLLGKGSFGEVWKGYLKDGHQKVAIKKCLEEIPEEEKMKFLTEARLMRMYKHPNIVQFIGVAAQKEPIMFAMELVDGGCLDDYLRKHKTTPVKKTKFLLDAAKGMEYIESMNGIHRDLAARNCLIGSDMLVKISDFGMSRDSGIYLMKDREGKRLPIKWTAPEALLKGCYSNKSDVWSFGILIWEVFTNCVEQPYKQFDNNEAVKEVMKGYRMPQPEEMPDQVAEIMFACLQKHPSERPTFAEIAKKLSKIYSKM